jgi:cysteine desulfurase / selenocysteine lyase
MRNDFPIFRHYPDLVYLDSASTSQKPQAVIDAVSGFYQTKNANIHRGIYNLSQEATEVYENTRITVSKFIGAKDQSEIIFTDGTTEAINLVAFGWARKFLKKGDIIVLSEMEHHSNVVAWLRLKEEIGIELFFLPITTDYRLGYMSLREVLQRRTTRQSHEGIASLPLAMTNRIKLVSLTHASNVLGTVNPVEEIVSYFKKLNPAIKICIDAAQSVPHLPVNVSKLDCDFLAFSSHKMLGPSGVGVLYARKGLLDAMDPFVFGSIMIRSVTKEKATWADVPEKFEPGTRNLEGVAGLSAAIDYLQNIGFEKIKEVDNRLVHYTLEKFAREKNVTLFGPKTPEDRLGVFSFTVGNVHPHDVSEILNRLHIAVRAGHHCAQPLMGVLGVSGTVRASIYLYNTKADIDRLFEGIEKVKKVFKM